MDHKQFAAAINCIDGRVQMPVINWIRQQYGVDFVDIITNAGPEKLLAEGKDQAGIESVRKCLEVSITRHNSKLVAIAAHHNCAGNPVSKQIQLQQIHAAVETVRSWQFDIAVAGLWVNENWEVQEVSKESLI